MDAPAQLLLSYQDLFCTSDSNSEPILDLACGDGRNGIFLAAKGCSVVLADRSDEMLQKADELAAATGVSVRIWKVDLEEGASNPLEGKSYGGILVFRYLHRPLMPLIREALIPGGILVYETYTLEQAKIGKPHSPDHLLRPGELKQWFGDWTVIHYHEGIFAEPKRAMAGIVCRKTEISSQESGVRMERHTLSTCTKIRCRFALRYLRANGAAVHGRVLNPERLGSSAYSSAADGPAECCLLTPDYCLQRGAECLSRKSASSAIPTGTSTDTARS